MLEISLICFEISSERKSYYQMSMFLLINQTLNNKTMMQKQSSLLDDEVN